MRRYFSAVRRFGLLLPAASLLAFSYAALSPLAKRAFSFDFYPTELAPGQPGIKNRSLGVNFFKGGPGLMTLGTASAGFTAPFTDSGREPAGGSCLSNDSNHICIGLKYVVYQDSANKPVLSEAQARRMVSGLNSLWGKCNMSFTLDKYVPVKPAEHGFSYQTANYSDLTAIRQTFMEDESLLVVTTGNWNRSGSLGTTGANAWTSLPGDGPYGVIMESPVGTNANLLAHEMGHYLNLLHVNDDVAMMNPVIYGRSTSIYESQCQTARSAALYFWPKMMR